MGTMQGWVTRDRLRHEREQAKIEQARKEGFEDGYLAGKVFAVSVAPMIDAQKETDRLQRELKEAIGDAAILAHAYSTDNRPPTNVVVRSIERGKQTLSKAKK